MDIFRIKQKLMGSAFELVIGHEDEQFARQMLKEGIDEISRIEKLLSEFESSSYTSELNRMAGIRAVEVPEEVYRLIQRCIKISGLTQGAFDITAGLLKKLYRFDRKSLADFPSAEKLKRILEKTGYRHIHLSKNNHVYLTKKGMRISFASIGKGYAADRVCQLWTDKGIKSGVINASGDLRVLGKKPDCSDWKVGIADPEDTGRMLLYIPVREGAVATSGEYEQFFIKDGKRYAHTLDPSTGMPVTGIKSVSITGKYAEMCDALATAVSVMGIETGLHLIDQLPGTHCLIIDDDNQIHVSKNIIFEKTNNR